MVDLVQSVQAVRVRYLKYGLLGLMGIVASNAAGYISKNMVNHGQLRMKKKEKS